MGGHRGCTATAAAFPYNASHPRADRRVLQGAGAGRARRGAHPPVAARAQRVRRGPSTSPRVRRRRPEALIPSPHPPLLGEVCREHRPTSRRPASMTVVMKRRRAHGNAPSAAPRCCSASAASAAPGCARSWSTRAPRAARCSTTSRVARSSCSSRRWRGWPSGPPARCTRRWPPRRRRHRGRSSTACSTGSASSSTITDYRGGCPIVAGVADASWDSPAVTDGARAAFATWLSPLQDTSSSAAACPRSGRRGWPCWW